jgi:hypothetical protein
MRNFDRESPAMSALALTDATRHALGHLLQKEQHRTGSREVAYETVAKKVGASSSWLKKFLSNHQEVKEPRITLFLSIRDAYRDLCNRVEQEHANELAKLAALRGQLNEVDQGFVEMVAGSNSSSSG